MSQYSISEGTVVDVRVTIKNIGMVDSDEVVQLYVSYPESKVERPAISLKGFKRIYIPAGESLKVTLPLNSDELKYWSKDHHDFLLEKVLVDIHIGASSKDIRLIGELMVH